MLDRNRALESFKTRAIIVYVLYLIGLFVWITLVAGVILAYLSRGRAEELRAEHLVDNFRWQINTFWGLLGFIFLPVFAVVLGLISHSFTFLTILTGLGVLSGLVGLIWFIYRVIKGWIALSEGRLLYTD